MTPSLLEQVCNNFTVVEVWHKTPGVNTDDEVYTHTDRAQYNTSAVQNSVVSVVRSCEAVPAPVLLGIL